MTQEEFILADQILWDPKFGPRITTNQEISELLKDELEKIGIKVIKVGRNFNQKNKFIHFHIKVIQIKGTDKQFLNRSDAIAWHDAKNCTISTLIKAPNTAFESPLTEEIEIDLWWSQAFKLAYRKGASLDSIKYQILYARGEIALTKLGIEF